MLTTQEAQAALVNAYNLLNTMLITGSDAPRLHELLRRSICVSGNRRASALIIPIR